MIETGVLVNLDGKPIYWHLPIGRSSAYLPDSPDLWTQFWENRNIVSGFAHSHPGNGIESCSPSWEDITTFSAVELGLGKKLNWWITSRDGIILLRHSGLKKYDYVVESLGTDDLLWLDELRRLSYKVEEV